MNCDKILKDLNLEEMQSDLKRQLFEGPFEQKKEILSILKADSMFLRKQNIMDYSLLLAIEDHEQTEDLSINSRDNEDTRNKIGNYHLGIIDFLQQFNF